MRKMITLIALLLFSSLLVSCFPREKIVYLTEGEYRLVSSSVDYTATNRTYIEDIFSEDTRILVYLATPVPEDLNGKIIRQSVNSQIIEFQHSYFSSLTMYIGGGTINHQIVSIEDADDYLFIVINKEKAVATELTVIYHQYTLKFVFDGA